jgi:copper(I)-binding protein
MVAYMSIENNSEDDITIVKAESDSYSSIEFHETRYEDGMARMIRHDNLLVPANNHITLKRGGKHFMLFNPVKRLKAGDSVAINLTTKNNVEKTIQVTVKKSQY